MLIAGETAAVQTQFMILIRKCAVPGKKLFPNIVMGAAAERIIADRGIVVQKLRSPDTMPKSFFENETNRLFHCVVIASPASLTEMLRTSIGGADELKAAQDFRLALLECNATRGRNVTVPNMRASAARVAFAMGDGVR